MQLKGHVMDRRAVIVLHLKRVCYNKTYKRVSEFLRFLFTAQVIFGFVGHVPGFT